MPPNNELTSSWHGKLTMSEAQKLQDIKTKTNGQVHILGCEHPLVLSVGRSLWKTYPKIPLKGVPYYLVSRGGKLTFHNEGQLMIYPLMNIKSLHLGIKTYLKLLFEVTQQSFQNLGLETYIDFESKYGVYVGSKKIVSAGLSYSKGWVKQGLAINLCNDLEVFKSIEICGHKGLEMTSALEQNITTSPKAFFDIWIKNFEHRLFH